MRSSQQSATYCSVTGQQQCQSVDVGHVRCSPPGLLPAGRIQTPSSISGTDTWETRAQRHPNIPVMHPNLVAMIKTFLSPTFSVVSDPNRREEVSMDAMPLTGINSVQSLRGMQNIEFDFPSRFDVSHACREMHPGEIRSGEETNNEDAAVVSVDFIQNRRPFKCAHMGCNKTFKNPQTMKMHHKTHYSNQAAARLGVQVLSSSSSLLKAGHNKKIPSRCPLCKKNFVGLYELRRHFGRKHSEGEKTFACKKCGKRFYIEVDLRDHEKLCGEPIECTCGMRFAFKCNLVAHKKSHRECQERFPNEEEFRDGAARGEGGFSATDFASARLVALYPSLQPLLDLQTLSLPPQSQPLVPPILQSSEMHICAGVFPLQEALGTSGYGVDRMIASSLGATTNLHLG